jgi:hypothetical protein
MVVPTRTFEPDQTNVLDGPNRTITYPLDTSDRAALVEITPEDIQRLGRLDLIRFK